MQQLARIFKRQLEPRNPCSRDRRVGVAERLSPMLVQIMPATPALATFAFAISRAALRRPVQLYAVEAPHPGSFERSAILAPRVVGHPEIQPASSLTASRSLRDGGSPPEPQRRMSRENAGASREPPVRQFRAPGHRLPGLAASCPTPLGPCGASTSFERPLLPADHFPGVGGHSPMIRPSSSARAAPKNSAAFPNGATGRIRHAPSDTCHSRGPSSARFSPTIRWTFANPLIIAFPFVHPRSDRSSHCAFPLLPTRDEAARPFRVIIGDREVIQMCPYCSSTRCCRPPWPLAETGGTSPNAHDIYRPYGAPAPRDGRRSAT